MPLTPDETNRRIRTARRRPPAADQPATADDVDQAERDILTRRAADANIAALPTPKQPSKPS